MGLLILIPTEFESQQLAEPLAQSGFPFMHCGAGLVNAAAHTAQIIAQKHPEALLLLGICGAYESSTLQIGNVVRVDSCVLADFGAQDSDGSFLPAQSLGLGHTQWSASSLQQFPVRHPHLLQCLQALRGVQSASVQCACGTDLLASTRASQTHTEIEEMEGAAVFAVAKALGVPVFQVRAVSNRAGLRDRSSWKIMEALEAMSAWLSSAILLG